MLGRCDLNRLLVALVLCSGCDMSYFEFQQASAEVVCEWVVECHPDEAGFDDMDDCLPGDPMEEPPPECTYDPDMAQRCMDALEALDCDDPLESYIIEECERAVACDPEPP